MGDFAQHAGDANGRRSSARTGNVVESSDGTAQPKTSHDGCGPPDIRGRRERVLFGRHATKCMREAAAPTSSALIAGKKRHGGPLCERRQRSPDGDKQTRRTRSSDSVVIYQMRRSGAICRQLPPFFCCSLLAGGGAISVSPGHQPARFVASCKRRLNDDRSARVGTTKRDLRLLRKPNVTGRGFASRFSEEARTKATLTRAARHATLKHIRSFVEVTRVPNLSLAL